MMGLVKDKKVYLINRNERMRQALMEYLSCTNNDHVFLEDLPPSLFGPKIAAHLTTEAINFLIEIALEHRELLEDERHTVYLEGC